MCGSTLHDLIIGGVIKGDWVDFIDKDVSSEPVSCFFCNECWIKMREIRNEC